MNNMMILGMSTAEAVGVLAMSMMIAAVLATVTVSAVTILSEIEAESLLDPDGVGRVTRREIEREALRRRRSYVVAIQKAPIFPFFLVLTLVSAVFFRRYGKYHRLVRRAVRRYWAY